jgi:hypothetical protein
MPDNYTPNNQVFSAYTPFRNLLRKMDLFKSLQAVWAHSVFQQFNRKLPPYIINCPIGYRHATNTHDFIKFHMHLWELETVTKEILINSPELGANKNLANWRYLSKTVNRLKELEETIAQIFSTQENVLLELHRISHRQFPWQTLPTSDKLIRYWKIYEPLQDYFKQKYEIDFDVYMTISMMLFGFYLDHFALIYPPNIELRQIKQVYFDNFLKYTCRKASELESELKSQLKMNQDYVYAYHSLKAYPLVKADFQTNEYVTCPLPTLLLNRTTEGIFYDLINVPGFDNAFGNSFQNYVGSYLKKRTNQYCEVLPEQTYGPRRHKKQTIDWIVTDQENSALFIECKTKRMTVGAKAALTNLELLQADLNKIAEAVVQTYETTIDYENGLYPQRDNSPYRKIYIIIATLEEWYLFGDKTKLLLEQEVLSIFREKGLDSNYLKKYHYFIISTENIEILGELLTKRTIQDIFQPKLEDPNLSLWHIRTYLYDKFPSELSTITNPFEEEYNHFLDRTLEKMQT